MNRAFSTSEVTCSIERAAEFIQSKQSPDGLWRDFHTKAGRSSEWVTGFVHYALVNSGQAIEPYKTLKELLYRQRRSGGWSYSREVPSDCDSTAWVMMAFGATPVWRPSVVERAIIYLKRHQHEIEGGFRTYVPEDKVDAYIGVSDPALTQGWMEAHSSVTALTLQALLFHGESISSPLVGKGLKYLLRKRTYYGIWHTYWWKGYAYCTYQSMRSLGWARALSASEFGPTRAFLISQQNQDGGWNDSGGGESEVFASAFTLLSLLLLPSRESAHAVEAGVSWLLRFQRANGSWPVAPILRIPPPMVKDPEVVESWALDQEGTGTLVTDQEGIFTAASALWALSVYRSTIA